MSARLGAVAPLLQTLLAEPAPEITIPGLDASDPVVWLGAQLLICYQIPPSFNVNPKGLALYGHDSSSDTGTVYANGLGAAAAAAALPADGSGCVNASVSPLLPSGRYTVALMDLTAGWRIVALPVSAAYAMAYFSGLTPAATYLTVVVSWKVDAARSSPRDLVRVVDSTGAAVFWFYTSCCCQAAPGAAAVTVPAGSKSFQIVRAGAVKGGYTPLLYPGGGGLAASVGSSWVPWAALGY